MNKKPRVLRRVVLIAGSLLLLPPLTWWLANRIDEAPLVGRDEMAFVGLLDPPEAEFVSLHFVNQPLQTVAQAPQGEHGTRLQGIERLPDECLTVTGDLPLSEVIGFLADAGVLQVRQAGTGRFVFESIP